MSFVHRRFQGGGGHAPQRPERMPQIVAFCNTWNKKFRGMGMPPDPSNLLIFCAPSGLAGAGPLQSKPQEPPVGL